MNKIVFFFLLSFAANASVLEKGHGYFHSNLSFSTSSSLWLRGDEKADYQGASLLGNSDKARRNYYQAGIYGYYGLGNGFQIGTSLRYGIVHLSNAPILGAAKGDTRSQISNLSVEAAYQIVQASSWDLVTALRYSHPGKQGRRHPEFLSFNDFTSYGELELKHSWFLEKIQLYSLIKYKKTLTSLGNNHLVLEEKAYYSFLEKFSLGLGIDATFTDGGFDIASNEFNQFTSSQGFLPVWNKKESWLGLSVLTKFKVTKDWTLDSYLHKKVKGKNTDIATTLGLGIGRSF